MIVLGRPVCYQLYKKHMYWYREIPLLVFDLAAVQHIISEFSMSKNVRNSISVDKQAHYLIANAYQASIQSS